ncbi:hypothetical protein EDD21DRAFT_172831 [Dissophora ornata]|nr:hypothetical protein BGZ58_011082 [Dissophora ornata]KAI8598971.1 hypothetical protein EDD21DRAFT_172831 [Dissophora ornata]
MEKKSQDATTVSHGGQVNNTNTDDSRNASPAASSEPISSPQLSSSAHTPIIPAEAVSVTPLASALTATSEAHPASPPPPAAKKPDWATGDPFFDTMAGMESSEYGQYSAAGTIPSTTHTATADTETADRNTGNGEGDSEGSTSTSAQVSESHPNTGLDHWNKTREQWTKGRWHVVPSANSNNPALSAIHPGNHDAIYDSLVYDRKRLSKPIPLPLVIKVLVSGWKRDGLWQESPTQPMLAPGSTPSQGINAYVPGFSSTNSQSVQKKL